MCAYLTHVSGGGGEGKGRTCAKGHHYSLRGSLSLAAACAFEAAAGHRDPPRTLDFGACAFLPFSDETLAHIVVKRCFFEWYRWRWMIQPLSAKGKTGMFNMSPHRAMGAVALSLVCLSTFGLGSSRLEISHLESSSSSGRVPSARPRNPRHHARKSHTGVCACVLLRGRGARTAR